MTKKEKETEAKDDFELSKGEGPVAPETVTQEAQFKEQEASVTKEEETKERELIGKMNEALRGRQESEVPLTDDYWKIRAELQLEQGKEK